MTAPASNDKHMLCRVGRHHYIVVNDMNPENLNSTHLECSHCAKIKEIAEYEPRVTRYEGTL